MKRKNILEKIKKYPIFYQKVWLCAMKISKGKTKSYKDIAKEIGKPKAYRAVALALSKNPLPKIIPCHRVIRSNGEIGGYSLKGGIKEKIKLLKKEKAI